MNKIRVLIADDHKLLREALSYLINSDDGFEVVAACEDCIKAIEITKKEKPDIVLMDINMTPFSGLEATQKIKDLSLPSRVIGMSVHTDPMYVKKMIKMGASGYVTKNSPKGEIIKAMKKVSDGEIYVCEEIKNILGDQLSVDSSSSPQLSSLTEREMQVVECIKVGQSSKEIAANFCVKLKTVEVHRHNILQKLKLKNVACLVNFVNNNVSNLA